MTVRNKKIEENNSKKEGEIVMLIYIFGLNYSYIHKHYNTKYVSS